MFFITVVKQQNETSTAVTRAPVFFVTAVAVDYFGKFSDDAVAAIQTDFFIDGPIYVAAHAHILSSGK